MLCNYRVILSVDGCGLNSIIPLQIIDFLNNKIESNFSNSNPLNSIDLYTSCSTSTIFTGALMLKDKSNNCIFSTKMLIDFYKKKGKSMFFSEINLNNDNSNYPLKFILEHFFGDIKLKDLSNHFLFFSYNLTNDNIFSFSKQNYRLYDLSLSKMMYACSVNDLLYSTINILNSELCDVSSFLVNPACLGYNYIRILYPDDYIVFLSIGFKSCSKGDKKVHFFQQKEEVHNKMLSIAESDSKLKYFRFQPDIQLISSSTENYFENECEILNFTNDYMIKNINKIDEILELFSLKYA